MKRKNAGYAITNLTHHTHVVWNNKDDALYSKTWTIDINTWVFWKKALGKYGDTTEGAMSHFTGKVTIHNFSPLYI